MNVFKLCIVTVSLIISIDAVCQKNKVVTVSPDVSKDKVAAEVLRLSLLSGGVVGRDAIHVEPGKRLVQNDLDLFPMASSYNIPIARPTSNLIADWLGVSAAKLPPCQLCYA